MRRGLKTACYHSLMHIDHFLKDADQWQSHSSVWCLFRLHDLCDTNFLEAAYIKTRLPELCRQKELVYILKLFR